MRKLFLIRGLPGSGKSTLADSIIADFHIESDMYFMKTGEYKFDPTKLHSAHKWCFDEVEEEMVACEIVQTHDFSMVVSNTFTTEKELKPYLELGKKHGFQITVLIVENRHGGKSIHGVPETTMEKMEKRFSVKLR